MGFCEGFSKGMDMDFVYIFIMSRTLFPFWMVEARRLDKWVCLFIYLFASFENKRGTRLNIQVFHALAPWNVGEKYICHKYCAMASASCEDVF